MSSRIRRLSATRRRLAPVALVAAATLMQPSCRDAREPKAPTQGAGAQHHEHEHPDEVTLTAEAAAAIKVAPASTRVLQPTFVAPARVAFNAEAVAHVGSPLRGRAIEVKARLGDEVSKGQELIVIESPELGEAQSDFVARRTAAQTSVPAAELAKAAWERARTLYNESQAVSLTDVQRRETEYKAAETALKAAEAAAIAAENRLRILGTDQNTILALTAAGHVAPRYSIRAPIDGQVVQREVTQGELVSPDRELLLVLADIRTVWVLAEVPEAHVSELAPGAKAWISVSFLGQARREAQIGYISPLVDPTTRTVQARMEVPASGPDGARLHPGLFALAEIASNSKAATDPVIAVPAEAVHTVEGGPAVFVPVEGEPNTFARRTVTVGRPVGGMIPILSGLSESEPVVVSGAFILKAELGKAGAAHEH